MSQEYIPQQDLQYKAWLENFAQVCDEYANALQLGTASVQLINGINTAFSTAMAKTETAKQIYRAAVTDKDTERSASQAVVRRFAREFKSNPDIPQDLLVQLGIVSNTVSGPVVPVTGLDANACSDGVNALKWNRNGNAQGTTFLIEYRFANSTQWFFAGATTKVKFDHVDQTPGVKMYYRVTSTRAGMTSVPCPAVVVYENGSNPGLSIAA